MKSSLITWKDADQNLCTIAASILFNAVQELRGVGTLNCGEIQMSNGEYVEPDYASPEPRTILGYGNGWGWYTNDIYAGGGWDQGGIEREADAPSSLCWWGFQNIVRWHLREARMELKRALYGADPHAEKAKRKSSRNYSKRQSGVSKFGRTKERK